MQIAAPLKSSRATLRTLLSVATALVALSCEDEAGTTLTDRDYLLDSAQGFEPVADTTVSLSIRGRELSFYAGCNGHYGAFSSAKGRLVVDGLGATALGCSESLQQQDEWLADFVTSRPQLTQSGDRLTLAGMDATLLFLDREVADPDRPLVDTSWTVDTFIIDGGASNMALEEAPTLIFHPNGDLDVFTGCNQGTGRYEVKGAELTFSAVGYSKVACSERAAFADAHVQAVVQEGQASFEIEGPRLTIERSNGDGLGALAP